MEVALTQSEKDQLRADPKYKKYFQDSIMGDDAGGVGFLLRLTSAVDITQVIAIVVARAIRKEPNIVFQDPTLLNFIDVQINVRDIDKKEDSVQGELLQQVTAYLNADNRITLLVGDYMANKGLAY
jgi:hypothetical protein